MNVAQSPIKPIADKQQRQVIAPPRPPKRPPSAPAPAPRPALPPTGGRTTGGLNQQGDFV